MNKIKSVDTCDAYLLIEALMRSGKAVETQLDAALAPIDLSAAKWNVLKALTDAGGPLPLGQLASKLSCVKSNATQLVDRLEAEKLVRRIPDAEDRRSVLAELTEQGEQKYKAGLKVVNDFERKLLDESIPEERFFVTRLLSRLSGINIANP